MCKMRVNKGTVANGADYQDVTIITSLYNWGEPERAPLLRGKQYGGPCTKNRGGKRHYNITTVVWYGGSCTNKHNKLSDTSIQVLCIAKVSIFMS